MPVDFFIPEPHQIVSYAASTAIINDNGETALFLRDDLPLWTNIGGNLDDGEDFEPALRREAVEETNLEIEIIQFIGDFYSPLGNDTYRHEKVYLSRAKKPAILRKPDDEGVAVRWFKQNELPFNIGPRFLIRLETALNPPSVPVSVKTTEDRMVQFLKKQSSFDNFIGLQEWLYHPIVIQKRQNGELAFDPLPLLPASYFNSKKFDKPTP